MFTLVKTMRRTQKYIFRPREWVDKIQYEQMVNSRKKMFHKSNTMASIVIHQIVV